MTKIFTREDIKSLIAVLSVMAIFCIGLPIISYYETHYTMQATVVSIETNGTVLVEDTTGNLWAFEGEGFKINDKVNVNFYTAESAFTREDDEVLNVVLIQSSNKSK